MSPLFPEITEIRCPKCGKFLIQLSQGSIYGCENCATTWRMKNGKLVVENPPEEENDE